MKQYLICGFYIITCVEERVANPVIIFACVGRNLRLNHSGELRDDLPAAAEKAAANREAQQ
jgi:hypothetical protein